MEYTNEIDEQAAPFGVDAIKHNLEEFGSRLRGAGMEPDCARQDWEGLANVLDEVEQFAGALLECTEAFLGDKDVSDRDMRDAIRNTVTDLVGDAVGLLHTAGRKAAAGELLARTAAVGEGVPAGELLVEAKHDVEQFSRLIRAWWLVRQGRLKEARAVAKALVGNERLPGISASAKSIVDAPRPLKRAPWLFSLNGFGTRIYGSRDHREDGSYVTTRYVTAVFVPLVPLDSFRVQNAEDEGYYFIARAKLSNVARMWRYAALAAVLAGIVYAFVGNYYSSDEYRMSTAIAQVEQAEDGQLDAEQREQLITRYEKILFDYPEADTNRALPALEGIVRLASASVPEPIALDDVAQVKRIVRRYESLPAGVRSGTGCRPMVDRLTEWAPQLGEAGEAALAGQLRILTDAERLARDDEERSASVRTRLVKLELLHSGILARDWPLEAIGRYSRIVDDARALRAAGELVAILGDGPSVWIELEPAIVALGEHAVGTEHAAAFERAAEKLAAAKQTAAGPLRKEQLAGGDLKALSERLAETPGDQEVAVAIAELQRGAGDPAAALATIEQLGAPGMLVTGAQLTLASVRAELGELEGAETLLRRMLSNKLPAFERARAEFEDAKRRKEAELLERGRTGNLPPNLVRELETIPESEQQTVFVAWLGEQLDLDVGLQRLREAYTAHADVVPIALTLGTVQLQRASATSGAAREAHLRDAEQAFLSIQGEAQGVPSYHLGLGQVFHRLGKSEEGEQEFARLLNSGEPGTKLAVANAYRELGLEEQAREVASAVYDTSVPSSKYAAASLLGLLARDRDERKQWFERADRSQPFIQESLLSIEASELYDRGEYAAADVKYAEVLKRQLEKSKNNPEVTNNAALTMQNRYQCTGNLGFVRDAIEALEEARRLVPDNALVVGNLASLLDYKATLDLLASRINLQSLPVTTSEATTILETLLEGEQRDNILEDMKKNASLRRALELYRQQTVLAPGSIDGYLAESTWYARTEDAAVLRQLLTRVEEAAGSLDTSSSADYRERWYSGELDDVLKSKYEGQLLRYDRLAKMLKRDAETTAALQLLRATALSSHAALNDDPERIASALEAYNAAHAGWGALETEVQVMSTLLQKGILEAIADKPELKDFWANERRQLGVRGVLLWCVLGGDERSQAMSAALRTAPAFGQAVARLRSLTRNRRYTGDWVIAQVAGDEQLLAETASAFSHEVTLPLRKLQVALNPGDRLDTMRLALFERHHKG